MKETILAIAGRSGLYRLVSRGHGNLIVEALDATKKRTVAGARDRVTALNEVSMYTDDEDVPLMTAFANLFAAQKGKRVEIDLKKADAAELAKYMTQALPNYDRDRVHNSDIKKLLQWYNVLVDAGQTDFEDADEAAPAEEKAEPKAVPAEEKAEPKAEEKAEKKPAKKTAKKA